MVKQSTLTFHMTDGMKERLEQVSENTGLGQSAIVRRGLLDQLNQLEEGEA